MKIPFFQIDAFSSDVFGGNPAGVCFLPEWLDDELLADIAAENNLSETAFLVRDGAGYRLRWFTPRMEIDLCGHATLAAAHAVFETSAGGNERVEFETASGPLAVERREGLLMMDFPSRPPSPCPAPASLAALLGSSPTETLAARDLLAVFGSEEEVAGLKPDFAGIATLDFLGVCVTAPGNSSDFVSRFFAPRAGVPEDPVTGSSHCSLIPYWAQRLGKSKLRALQLSKRGGELFGEARGGRVNIGGRAVIYLTGEIQI